MKRIVGLFVACFILSIALIGISGTIKYANKHIKNISTNNNNFEKGDMPSRMNNNIDDNKSNIEKNDSNFKRDGVFSGGETTTTNNRKLTFGYIILLSIFVLIASLDIIYVLMSCFCGNKVFTSSSKLIIYILSNILLVPTLVVILTIIGNDILSKSKYTIEYSSTDDLHINMSNWSYDSDNNVYYQIGLVYVSKPATKEYESMGIYVPGDYMDCKTKDTRYECTLNKDKKVGDYTSSTAPIVMPINTAGYSAQEAPTSYNYNGIASYIKEGFIYVYSGARGRNNGNDYSGGAPWGVTDFKAAIRYLRYNSSFIPGNTDNIFVFGHSGGGAQSTIIGASGDSELYIDYLNEIGALMKDDEGKDISDTVKGVMAWCPITNLDVADAAYEWNMGQFSTSNTRDKSTWTSALSNYLSEEYAKYINELKLKDSSGNTLSLKKSKDGIYLSGTYYDYLKEVIERSLTNYLNDNYDNVSDMKKYVSEYSWIKFDEKKKRATITSVKDFISVFKNASKSVGAFDDLNRSQAENYVFGNSESDALHFDTIMSNILNSKDFSKYSDYNSKYASEYKSDLDNKDDLGKSSLYRQNMYNPMYYLSSYYEGYKKSKVSDNWRIRTGITQGDTALTTEMNLSLALKNYGIENVDFETIWNQGHTTAERTGNSTTNFISWVNEICKK